MVEVESRLADQAAEPLVEDTSREVYFEIRSLNQDTTSRILLALIAVCGFGVLMLLALVLAAATTRALGINLPGVTAVGEFLGSSFMGLGLTIIFVVTGLVSYFILRRRVLGNPMLYTNAGCPQCWEKELVRVRRHKADRMIAHLGIPVRRYRCRNCDWAGLRVGGQSPSALTIPETPSDDNYWGSDEILGGRQHETAAGEKL